MAIVAQDPPPECYVCPLCLRGFGVAALETNALTLEHAPPESIGGRAVCLTCSDCNHWSGSEIDHHMLNAERAIAFNRGEDVSVRGSITLSGVKQKGQMSFRSGQMIWQGVPRANRPGVTEDFVQAMTELVALGRDGMGTRIDAELDLGFDERRVNLGWARAAYLIAFAALGYRYILQPSLDSLRAQIADPAEDGFVCPVASEPDAAADRRALFLVDDAKGLRGLHVGIGRRRIWLPHLRDPDYVQRVTSYRHQNAQPEHVEAHFIKWPDHARFAMDADPSHS